MFTFFCGLTCTSAQIYKKENEIRFMNRSSASGNQASSSISAYNCKTVVLNLINFVGLFRKTSRV